MIETFSIVVAHDQAKGIGKNGQMSWHLPGEMAYFKQLTSQTKDPAKQNVVIMGRKTYESLPQSFRPLPGRINVVLTQNPTPNLPKNVPFFNSLDTALHYLLELENQGKIERVFCIGGGKLYQDSIYHASCQHLYITKIHATFDCDTFFPDYEHRFSLVWESDTHTENNISYSFTHHELIP